MPIKQFFAMFKARSMEFLRDRGTFWWNLLFPIVMVFGFAFAFTGDQSTLFKVGTFGTSQSQQSFLKIPQIQFIHYDGKDRSLDSVLGSLRQHQLEMVIDLDTNEYWTNSESAGSQLVKRLFLDETAKDGQTFREEVVQGKAIRYVDRLVPGVIGMNLTFSCLFGVGYVIVRYRKNGVLKRMKATPVSALNFISAQALSRLVITLVTSVVVFVGTNAILHFTMNGSYVNLVLITILAIACMISLGLLFASRFKSEELVNGLLNLITFPMIIFSGVFFSLEGAPAFVQNFAKVFPLTHFVDGARKIMLDGAGFAAVAPDLLFLGVLTAIFLGLAAWLFRWD